MAIDPETRTGTLYGYEIKAYSNLAHADLNRVDLNGANLHHADLNHAKLIGTKLHETYLWGADLRGARMMNAELIGADVASANLYGADLSGADLTEASLWGADLQEATLFGADLTGADLTGANFRGARVDAHHVPLIEAAYRYVIKSLIVSGGRSAKPRGRKRNGGPVHFLDRNNNVWEACSLNDVDGVNFGPRGAARRISRKSYSGYNVVGMEADWRIVELRPNPWHEPPF